MASESQVVVYAEIAANIVVMAAKFFAAAISGSAGMLAEAFHSLVDTGDGLLLLLGQHLARRPPDPAHPLGHGLEVYFWTFIVALLIFAVGGGLSIHNGITHVLRPEPLGSATWSYVVLGVATVFEGGSFAVAWRKFRKDAGTTSIWQALRVTRDMTTAAVLLENAADLIGILIAFAGVLLSHVLDLPLLDGIASILIGLVLVGVAGLLGYESRSLLLGERADPRNRGTGALGESGTRSGVGSRSPNAAPWVDESVSGPTPTPAIPSRCTARGRPPAPRTHPGTRLR
ncbi:MAG TPA: cation diffusion facilitator family transporter [Gemmatimonadaceae bacterium]|nr:cation diffusion facilitator family transporter [Gemmatimonadaceae bacterium]